MQPPSCLRWNPDHPIGTPDPDPTRPENSYGGFLVPRLGCLYSLFHQVWAHHCLYYRVVGMVVFFSLQ